MDRDKVICLVRVKDKVKEICQETDRAICLDRAKVTCLVKAKAKEICTKTDREICPEKAKGAV